MKALNWLGRLKGALPKEKPGDKFNGALLRLKRNDDYREVITRVVGMRLSRLHDALLTETNEQEAVQHRKAVTLLIGIMRDSGLADDLD